MPRPDRTRAGVLGLLAAVLAGCAVAPPPSEPAAIAGLPEGTACRVGPGGGPIDTADRGIGGTGEPARAVADRGIGGTGIIGVITGFASICLAGHEVAYGPAVPISIDGRTGQPSDLRAGQVAAVEASGTGTALEARRVLVRHEVAGPVQAREAGLWRIAGQRVAIAASALGTTTPAVGAWVAVSGLRDADGVIQATRIDVAPVQPALVHGTPIREAGRVRIGTAELRMAPGLRLPRAGDVLIVGTWVDGVLMVDDVRPDPLAGGAGALFGPGVGVIVVESFAGLNEDRLLLTRTRQGGVDGSFRSTVTLERRADGAFRPMVLRDGPGRGGAGFGPVTGLGGAVPPGRFEPAPLPNRTVVGPRGFGPGNGDGRRGQVRGDQGRGDQGRGDQGRVGRGFPAGAPDAPTDPRAGVPPRR